MGRVLSFCAVLLLAGVLACIATLSAADPEKPSPEAEAKVSQLVKQLGDADAGRRNAAATALLKMGPEILPLLPVSDDKQSDEQKKQLAAVRITLRDAQAQRDLAPKTITLQNNGVALGKALEELAKQTGVTVEDRRRDKDSDPSLKLDLKKATFWEALDAIARESDTRVNLYEKDGKIALVDGPFRAASTSYHGPFRVTLKRLHLVRDLETDAHFCEAEMEIAWEPRLHPVFLESRPDSVEIQDDKGDALKLPEAGGGGRSPVAGPLAMETHVRLEAPKRAAEKLALFKGTLNLWGPTRLLTFSFDMASFDAAKSGGKEVKQTLDGVTVKVREFKADKELWDVGLTLEYPPESPEFESFESWLVSNRAFLEKKADKKRYPTNGGEEIGDQAGHKALVNYRFTEDGELSLGKPENWNFIYTTPATILKIPIPFEFKDVPLP